MTYTYKTQGTCSSNIELDVEDGIVKEVAFWGGCNGNLHLTWRYLLLFEYFYALN